MKSSFKKYLSLSRFQFSSKLKCGFERNPWKVELEVPIYKQPHFMGYLLVAPAENFLLGYRTVFNVEDRNFAMHGFCLGYDNKTTEVALKLWVPVALFSDILIN